MNILIIEDDPGIGRTLRQCLGPRHSVHLAPSGRTGLYNAQNGAFDLILLDLGLPDISGAEVCQQLRNLGFNKPILVISAESQIMTKVALLDSGADDYLTKPFSTEELSSRVTALLRRIDPELARTVVQTGDLTLDVTARQVRRAGQLIPLRRKEFELLEYLMRHPGIALSRSRLLDNVWDINENPWPNTVDAQIKNLREKVDRPFERKVIKTIYGLGYRLDATTDAAAIIAVTSSSASTPVVRPSLLVSLLIVSLLGGLWYLIRLLQHRIAASRTAVAIERTLELQRYAEIGRLTATLLHDLAGPLTTAKLSLQLLTDSRPSTLACQASRSITCLERYVMAARRQLQQEGQIRLFGVGAELRQVLNILSHRARMAQVTISIEPQRVRIYGDPVKFNHLAANLIANAIDAYDGLGLPSGQATVNVTVEKQAGTVILSVTDHGSGIPDSALGHIFRPFFTTKASSERGTGLGLSIAQRICEDDFGGSLKVTSTVAAGTTFTARLHSVPACARPKKVPKTHP